MARVIAVIMVASLALIMFAGCEENTTVLQSETESYTYRYANVELIFNFDSIFGEQLTLNNANAMPVGVYVVDNNNPDLVVFTDNWTWNGSTNTTTDINFSEGQELKVIIVIYSQEGILAFPIISLLGSNFLSGLEDTWIQEKHEEVIILQ
ncbi:MAG: hypothetical protein COT24_03655 [Candidatus Kerfeldbacteria bacterium CG08_land_8_20_14_0_20_40_16]|uniref:LTD domain-containing protein n=1 Tax=Candidatus Kerfeldbacteria bacterium CG08_land_8_20_14_0_20_40_16 TaxID=2014244 RepID=A0A2H0YVD1_9BACT|nr:MAG: hypothetical protein COT24_03655 [Candidatus Kerfeldbacteria bacterium CG08_land_8_20_14_0_20_40_16]